jgi:sec-independent protein translocase protein TatC
MDNSDQGFLEHLEELRKRLLVSLAAIGICAIVAYFFSGPFIDFLILPLRKFTAAELYFQTPYEAFLAHLKVSFLAGVLLSSPVFLTQLWLFVSPGLYPHEKRAAIPLIFVSIVLFLLGAAFAFWILIPLGLRFLLAFQTEALKPLLGIGPYFSFLIGMILACGIVFDLPIVVLGLVRVGILNSEKLKKSRKGVIVLIFVLAAVLTPSPDVVSQVLLAVPLLLLYEGCIWAAKWVRKK